MLLHLNSFCKWSPLAPSWRLYQSILNWQKVSFKVHHAFYIRHGVDNLTYKLDKLGVNEDLVPHAVNEISSNNQYKITGHCLKGLRRDVSQLQTLLIKYGKQFRAYCRLIFFIVLFG